MKVLIIPGSVRPNSVNKAIVPYVKRALAAHDDLEVEVASLDDIRLPFYDGLTPPSVDGFESEHEDVRNWTAKVESADAFVFVVPEYNHSITAIQKNAIDWVYRGWNDKKAAVVTYNHYDHKNAVDTLKQIFPIVKLTMVEPLAGLKFGVDVSHEGEILDETLVKAKIEAAVAQLLVPVPELVS